MWTDIMSGGGLLLPSGDKKMKIPISLLGTIKGGWDALLQADKGGKSRLPTHLLLVWVETVLFCCLFVCDVWLEKSSYCLKVLCLARLLLSYSFG